MLMMKKHVPVRLVKNKFYEEVKELEASGASKEELIAHLGKNSGQGFRAGAKQAGQLSLGDIKHDLIGFALFFS